MIYLKRVRVMENKVIAISGYSGSGKTTICESIIYGNSNFIYFDFGYLFRPLTYYLFYENQFDELELNNLIISDKLFQKIKFSYRVEDNTVKIGINNKFYDDNQLFTTDMNIKTLMVGTLIGDKINGQLCQIIDDLKKRNNVLINARRPIEVYPSVDDHIFLKADFDERVKRKMVMNNESYEETREKLMKRDRKEEQNGFWLTYDFTKIIDTTNLSKNEVKDEVLKIIKKSNIKFTFINNLTLVLGSYRCNKNCPYCIAKNNQKFSSNDCLEYFDNILEVLNNNGFKFNKFVLSGNGEPSLYNYSELEKIKKVLEKYCNLFDLIRIHSSGNIFFDESKFNLFNSSNLPIEFEILRLSLDSALDKKILGYKDDYLSSPLFKRSKSIKCDIALTDYLDYSHISEDLEYFLAKNPNISQIRFKKLLEGDFESTDQAKWVREHSLYDDIILKIMRELDLTQNSETYSSSDGRIIYKPNGIYDRDIVINDRKIQDYEHNQYDVKTLKRKFGN